MGGNGTGQRAGDGGERITDKQLEEINKLVIKVFKYPDKFPEWLRKKFGIDNPGWLPRKTAGLVVHALYKMEKHYVGKD